MKKQLSQDTLSRRERQIMDVIFQKGRATAAEVLEMLPDPPSYSAVRALLRILEDKGHLCHTQDGPRYVYSPSVSVETARKSAISNLMHTLFQSSPTHVVATLLDVSRDNLTDADLDRLQELIKNAKQEDNHDA